MKIPYEPCDMLTVYFSVLQWSQQVLFEPNTRAWGKLPLHIPEHLDEWVGENVSGDVDRG